MFNHKVLVISMALTVLLFSSIHLCKSSFCEMNANAVIEKQSYLALGDSYSAGQTPYGVAVGRSYTDIISEKLASVGVLKNYFKEGVSGYQTTDVMHQLPRIEEMIFHADLVTIDIGINDILLLPEVEAYRSGSRSVPFDVAEEAALKKIPEIKGNILEIINYMKAVNPDKNPRIYLMGYFNAFPNSPEFYPIIIKLNEAIQSAAMEAQVNYVDSMAAIDQKLFEYLPGDIHPTVEGYEAIAEAFLEQIMKDIMMDWLYAKTLKRGEVVSILDHMEG